jgi:hypothetical protein
MKTIGWRIQILGSGTIDSGKLIIDIEDIKDSGKARHYGSPGSLRIELEQSDKFNPDNFKLTDCLFMISEILRRRDYPINRIMQKEIPIDHERLDRFKEEYRKFANKKKLSEIIKEESEDLEDLVG